MPRALSVRTFTHVAASRDERLRALRARRAMAKGHGCNYWVFTDEGDPESLVEFVEGPDRAAVLAGSGPDVGGSAPQKILLEVELG
jgi:hypothetical protein